MKDSLGHLPDRKRAELARIVSIIRQSAPQAEMIILFGSYARGDWKDGPHQQGRGKLTIHKRSDYDILVLTANEYSARDVSLWDNIKKNLAGKDLSTHVRIIARDIRFVNYKLGQGQYFFTDIKKEGIVLYDSGQFKLARRKKLKPAEQKQIAQSTLDEVFTTAKEAYDHYEYALGKDQFKKAAFELHQATEFASKAVLLIFGSECPQEHHLDILGDLAVDYCPQLSNIIPRQSEEEKELFELLDYAYIGARYDRHYKITKEQLEQLAPCVKKLHKVTESICKEKIDSFV